jgi:hypothetical protein
MPAMDDEVKDRKCWLDSIQEVLQIVLTFAALSSLQLHILLPSTKLLHHSMLIGFDAQVSRCSHPTFPFVF